LFSIPCSPTTDPYAVFRVNQTDDKWKTELSDSNHRKNCSPCVCHQHPPQITHDHFTWALRIRETERSLTGWWIRFFSVSGLPTTGISMFANLQQILQHNRRNYLQYHSILKQVSGLRMFSLDHLHRTNWQYIVVEVDESQFGQSRDGALEHLRTNGILARRYFYPGCHRMQPYQSLPGNLNSRLENTNRLCERVLCLPTGCAVSAEDINRICDVLLNSQRSQAAA